MMAERGLSLAHTTIMRWIQRYAHEFEKRWNRFARPVGQSWRVDETYVKIKGRWTYLYRAVDKEGKTVDVLLRAKRDVAAAKVFFRRAFRGQGRLPHKITLDGYQASHRAASEVLGEHPEGNRCEIRSSKYLNNLIEQDHRSIKLRLGPMLGFKRFRRAATTIAGSGTSNTWSGPITLQTDSSIGVDAGTTFADTGAIGGVANLTKVGVGTLVLTVNVSLLSLYTFSCHSLRHLAGGKLDCFSCATFGRSRFAAWRISTFLNEHHMLFAWCSLFSVGFADFYVRLVASGAIRDLRLL